MTPTSKGIPFVVIMILSKIKTTIKISKYLEYCQSMSTGRIIVAPMLGRAISS